MLTRREIQFCLHCQRSPRLTCTLACKGSIIPPSQVTTLLDKIQRSVAYRMHGKLYGLQMCFTFLFLARNLPSSLKKKSPFRLEHIFMVFLIIVIFYFSFPPFFVIKSVVPPCCLYMSPIYTSPVLFSKKIECKLKGQIPFL